MANESLRQARAAKNDEFYSQWADTPVNTLLLLSMRPYRLMCRPRPELSLLLL